jgi:hypothetical protein
LNESKKSEKRTQFNLADTLIFMIFNHKACNRLFVCLNIYIKKYPHKKMRGKKRGKKKEESEKN